MPDQTVFVTGATGFIAKHIVLQLLNAGYRVRGSVRNLDRGTEVRDAVLPHLDHADDLDERLSFAALDLTRDEGWQEALNGADALFHTASPFPMTQPDNPEKVVRPAVEGALRALRAARDGGIDRVVMTSSVVAVVGTDLPEGRAVYSEADWTDTDRPGTTPYAISKTKAERAAWDFVQTEAPEIALTMINPGLVLGPPLDPHYGTSIALIERVLRAKDPMVPVFGFAVVDVRDVALAHVRALERPESGGKRVILSDRFLWMHEIAEIIAAEYPDRKVVTRRAPNFLVRLLGLFDKAIASIVPELGQRRQISSDRARDLLGIEFIDAAESVRATAEWLIRNRDL